MEMSSTPAAEVRSPRYGFQSPNVRTRFQEKEELSDLNDRLATYIRRMQQLEYQNNKLSAEISSSKQSVSREVENVKALYEAELADARRMIDELSKDKAALTLENDKLSGIIDDLRAKLDKETSDRERAQNDLKHTERRLHEKELLAHSLSKERKALDDKCKDLEGQVQNLLDELDKEKAKVEDEMLRRVDMENKYQTLLEEKKFNEEIHRKEVVDLRRVSDSLKFKMETDGPPVSHDDILREKLEELRDLFEEEAENARQELVAAYSSKNEALQSELERSNTSRLRLIEKYDSLKSELDKLKSDYGLLEAKNKQLQKQVLELENLRLLDKDEFARQLQDYIDKNKDLQDEINKLREEYQILLSIKVALDMEISAYRKLLEGEEERLNLSPAGIGQQRSQSTGGSRRGTKRRRPVEQETIVQDSIESSAVGNVEIIECDPKGKFVKLQNKSDNEDEALGGWFVQRVVNGRDEDAIEYKFRPKYSLKAGQTVTIWSASSGVKQKTPTDLLLRNNENWHSGRSMVTQVINAEAEIVAKQTMVPSFGDDTVPRRARKRRTGQDRESCAVM